MTSIHTSWNTYQLGTCWVEQRPCCFPHLVGQSRVQMSQSFFPPKLWHYWFVFSFWNLPALAASQRTTVVPVVPRLALLMIPAWGKSITLLSSKLRPLPEAFLCFFRGLFQFLPALSPTDFINIVFFHLSCFWIHRTGPRIKWTPEECFLILPLTEAMRYA